MERAISSSVVEIVCGTISVDGENLSFAYLIMLRKYFAIDRPNKRRLEAVVSKLLALAKQNEDVTKNFLRIIFHRKNLLGLQLSRKVNPKWTMVRFRTS